MFIIIDGHEWYLRKLCLTIKINHCRKRKGNNLLSKSKDTLVPLIKHGFTKTVCWYSIKWATYIYVLFSAKNIYIYIYIYIYILWNGQLKLYENDKNTDTVNEKYTSQRKSMSLIVWLCPFLFFCFFSNDEKKNRSDFTYVRIRLTDSTKHI